MTTPGKSSKFRGVLDAAGRREQAQTPEPKAKAAPAVGRRQDPAYGQISAYVRKDQHREVRAMAVRAGTNLSELLSAVLEMLLEDEEFAARTLARARDQGRM
jgi:uncharacterized protein YgbK (DUF1537 family)